MESWEIVDNYFCKICDIPEEQLASTSRSLVGVWHSFGVIQSGGMHNFLGGLGSGAQKFADHYRAADIEAGAVLIERSLGLWEKHLSALVSKSASADEFRSIYDAELDSIEDEFYELEDLITEKLLPVARRHSE